jgi:CheY-like chemotaxis protein
MQGMKKVIIAEPVLRAVEKSNTLFGRGGIAVFPARTSEDVLALHRANNADLIVTDFALPVMDGTRLCLIIRGDSALKDVSLIMVCDAGGLFQAQCLQAGANTVMTKPVDPFELFTHVAELLVIPQRQDMRALLHVSAAGREETTSFPGVSRNISISGMLLEADTELQKGERLVCAVDIGGREITTECEVVRVEKSSTSGFHYGVKFLNIDTKSMIIIDQFVRRRITR